VHSPPVTTVTTGALALGCPRCGVVGPHSLADGMCLVCLGEWALQFDFDTGGFSAGTAPTRPWPVEAPDPPEGVPDRVGPYELLDELGRGGMGIVFTARHRDLGHVVALKLIAGGRLATAEQESRFLREAQTAARLRHPGIVAVHDAGRAAGHAYYAMDYLPAGDLARCLRERALTPREAATVAAQAAEAVAYAHAQGVLHRDLKPSNFLLERGEPRLADFGLAAPLDATGDLTAQTRVLGTPGYVAPEIVDRGSHAATVATDVYGLGAVLYEMLGGRAPFAGATPLQVLELVRHAEPLSPRLLNPAVPRDLETVCLKCLGKDPARRYQSAADLAVDLRRFLRGEPIAARPLSAPARFWRWCRRRPALAAVWFLVVACAVGASAASVAIARERTRAVAAEQATRAQLAQALLAEAQALRLGGRMGRRFEALEALRQAAAIAPSRELRDEVITTLTLADARLRRVWRPHGERESVHAFAPAAGVYVVERPLGTFEVRALADDALRATLTSAGEAMLGTPRFDAAGRRLAARAGGVGLCIWNVDIGGDPVLVWADRVPPVPPLVWNNAHDFDFSPEGTRFAAGLPGGGFSVHSLPGGEELLRVPGAEPVLQLRFSPDGGRLAVGRRNEAVVRFHDAGTGAELAETALPTPPIHFDWSPDGAWLAATQRDARTVIADTASGAVVSRFRGAESLSGQVLFDAGGERLWLNDAGSVLVLWDWRQERPVLTVPGFGGKPVMALDGATGRFTASRWNLDSAAWFEQVSSTVYRRVEAPGGARASIGAGGVAVSPNGQLAAVGTIAGATVRRLEDLGVVGTFFHGANVDHTVRFGRDGRSVFVADLVHGLAQYDLVGGAGEPRWLVRGAGWRVLDVAGDRRVLLQHYGEDRLRVVDPAAPESAAVEWLAPAAWRAGFSPDGREVVSQALGIGRGVVDDPPRIWDAWTGEAVGVIEGRRGTDVAWSPAGVLVFGLDGALHVRGRAEGPARRLSVEASSERVMAVSAAGDLAAVLGHGRIDLVHLAAGEIVATLVAAERSALAYALEFTPAGDRLVANEINGGLVVWELAALRRELAALGLDW
jgi:WD40 repeat protein